MRITTFLLEIIVMWKEGINKRVMEEETLTLRDHLAIERTKLANERTFLAYFRTAIGMLASGAAIIGLEFFHEIQYLGYALIIIAPIMFLVGLLRTIYVKRKIKRYYKG